MKEDFIEWYREWVSKEPLYEVESMEQHVARFMEWVMEEKLPAQAVA